MIRTRVIMVVLLGAIIALCDSVRPASSQNAQTGASDDLAALLPQPTRKQVCFARSYDAGHLKSHPRQRVTAVVFSMSYRHEPTDDDPDPYEFGLSLKRKTSKRTLYAAGNCRTLKPLDADFLAKLEPDQRTALENERKALRGGPALQCYIECDGVEVFVERAADAGSLLIHLDRLRMTTACGDDEDAVEVTGGADDRVFRVDKAPPAVCRALDRAMR